MRDELPPVPSTLRPRSHNRMGKNPVRHGRLKHSRPVATMAKIVVSVVAVVAVSTASLGAFVVVDLANKVQKAGIPLALAPGQTATTIPDVGAIEGGVNFLLAGSDTRVNQAGFQNKADLAAASGAGHNDVTMLLHISQDHSNATVISIPRDLMVTAPACPRPGGGSIPGSNNVMFNTTLDRGGLACTVLTVEKLTGLTIPFASVISFDGVIAMSNAIGGVSVCIATPISDKYQGLKLPAGIQKLEGATALAFVRSRHGVADGSDLGRISNQQVFLSALMRGIVSAGVLSNPLTLYKLATAAISNMQLSESLTHPTTLISIAMALKGIKLSDVVFLQYPSVVDPNDPNRVVPQTSTASILNAALRADKPVVLTGTLGRAAELAPGSSPSPSATAAAPSTSAAPSTNPSGAASPPANASGAVQLPSSITGQTAAQETCTVGVKG